MPGTVLGLGSTRGTRTRSLRKGRHTGLAVTARFLPALLDIVNAHPDGCVVVAFRKATIWSRNVAALTIVEFRDPAHARLLLYDATSRYEQLA
jgi:probable phosphoglycerate mutase